MLERDGEVRATVVPNRRKKVVQDEILGNVEAGNAGLYRCAFVLHGDWRTRDYVHKVIDHAEKYVDGRVHTNGIENFWSLCSSADSRELMLASNRFTCSAIIDEQVFRFNYRKKPMDDFARFKHVASHVIGKRLTYAEVTGKVGATDFLPN